MFNLWFLHKAIYNLDQKSICEKKKKEIYLWTDNYSSMVLN